MGVKTHLCLDRFATMDASTRAVEQMRPGCVMALAGLSRSRGPTADHLDRLARHVASSPPKPGSPKNVRWCCPPRHGCNASGHREPCALTVCERFADDDRDAALALARWCALGDALAKHGGSDELRFRRRAYERVRNRALVAIALREAAGSPPTGTNTSRVRS